MAHGVAHRPAAEHHGMGDHAAKDNEASKMG